MPEAIGRMTAESEADLEQEELPSISVEGLESSSGEPLSPKLSSTPQLKETAQGFLPPQKPV